MKPSAAWTLRDRLLFDALKPMHDDARAALDCVRHMEVTTATPPPMIESIEERRRVALGLVEKIEQTLFGLRHGDYVATVRDAAGWDKS